MNSDESNESVNKIIHNSDHRSLFNLTKLVGEELCKKSGKDYIIVRPSNVYGLALKSPLFLPAITRSAINNGVVDMYVMPEYKKDYVSVLDVSEAIYKLSKKKDIRKDVFNIGSGRNTSALEIARILEQETGCKVTWHEISSSSVEVFPITDNSKIISTIDIEFSCVLNDLKSMIYIFRKKLSHIK